MSFLSLRFARKDCIVIEEVAKDVGQQPAVHSSHICCHSLTCSNVDALRDKH